MQQYLKITAAISVLLHFAQEQRSLDDKYAYELLTTCSPFIQAQIDLKRTYKQEIPITTYWEQYVQLANDLEIANQ